MPKMIAADKTVVKTPLAAKTIAKTAEKMGAKTAEKMGAKKTTLKFNLTVRNTSMDSVKLSVLERLSGLFVEGIFEMAQQNDIFKDEAQSREMISKWTPAFSKITATLMRDECVSSLLYHVYKLALAISEEGHHKWVWGICTAPMVQVDG